MRVIGIMSGTSLDGLDIALCEFSFVESVYYYEIKKAITIKYSSYWKNALVNVKSANAEGYFALNAEFGRFIGSEINNFLNSKDEAPSLIASHGHTIFHQPNLGFSTQLGCGATIAAHSGITTICDFRSFDLANGGQGAPLVPIGDKLLFGKQEACLNIGGIANISFDDKNGNRIAYDICEANMLLNYLAEKVGRDYDEGGELAKNGSVNTELLNKLNSQNYYSQTGAKSIGREWFEQNILPLVQKGDIKINDLLATSTEHISQIIANDLVDKKNVLVTGGGAFNSFLIEKIKSKTTCEIIIPDAETINFKEALIFAFLGYLRMNKKTNTLRSVTGAKCDSVGGAVYLGKI